MDFMQKLGFTFGIYTKNTAYVIDLSGKSETETVTAASNIPSETSP
jgi:hypothetical protein